jgi:hypothetical protein
MPVAYDLSGKRRVTADLDRYVAPVGVQDMKRIMIHIRHGLLAFQMMLLPTHTYFPNRRLRFPHQDQNTPRVIGVVLRYSSARSCFRSSARQSITGTALALAQPRTRRLKRPAKAHQMGIVQCFHAPSQVMPPDSEPAGIVSGTKVTIENDPIYAIVAACEQILVKCAQAIRHKARIAPTKPSL